MNFLSSNLFLNGTEFLLLINALTVSDASCRYYWRSHPGEFFNSAMSIWIHV